jgi:hypothetical protein
MKIYTKIDGKLAQWDWDSPNIELGLNTIRREMPKNHTAGILAVVPKTPWNPQLELPFDNEENV